MPNKTVNGAFGGTKKAAHFVHYFNVKCRIVASSDPTPPSNINNHLTATTDPDCVKTQKSQPA